MQRWYSVLLPRSARSLGWLAIGIAAAFAALALTGWVFGIETLKSILPHATAMRVITVLCFLLSTTALACLQSCTSARWRRWLSRVAGVVVGSVGLLTVVSYLVEAATKSPWSWGLLPAANLFLAPSTRMAVITALLFSIFGLVLLLLGTGTPRTARIAHLALLPVALMSYMVIAGYLFDVQVFYDWMHLGVALNTGLAFCALCLAAFCVRPDTWVMQVFSGEEAGAVMARRLLPGLLVLPLVIGWLRIEGERAGLFSSELGVALVAVTYTVSFLVLIWRSAGAVNRTDRRRREVEESLRESERRWATTLASIGDAVIATEAAGNVAFLNSTAEKLTGWVLAEATGKPVTEVFRIISEQTRAEVESPVARVLREGTVVGLANHTLLVRRDGTEVPIDDSGAPIRDESGGASGVVLVFRDITERKQAEEAVQRQARLLDLSYEAIFAWEFGGPIISWNRGAQELYGYSQKEAVGRVSHELLQTVFADGVERVLAKVTQDKTWADELVHRAKDGRTITVESRLQLVEDPSGRQIVLETNRDITERKRAEQAQLEAERAQVRLAQALTSEIAHRTKNNLAIVAGLLQLQLDRDDAPDSHADLIRDAVTRIMSFAALHEQMYQRHSETVELVDVLRRIAEVDRQALSTGEVTISVEGEPAEYPASIATNLCVVANELVTNAVKHGSLQEGARQVEVRLSREGGKLVLSVWNSHNPVPADFDVRGRGRTGLGLVRSIVEDQYGGSFALVPDRGGTLAHITLDDERLR